MSGILDPARVCLPEAQRRVLPGGDGSAVESPRASLPGLHSPVFSPMSADRKSMPAPQDDVWIADLRRSLLAFFREHARTLPWRETDDPYAIWVSEIMLQQTRVDTVIPYYQRWLERFPTPEALAAADPSEVLKCWEGLGYYSRARNLQQAARVVREDHGGRVPASLAGLRSLPGVGAYTAGAVGSIAFGLRAPAVDGNVRRVVARLLDWPDPAARPLEETVAAWVPVGEPGDFNQSLMELGATVCTPKNPGCYICPVADLCAARAVGTVDQRPIPKKKTRVRREVHAVRVHAAPAPGGEWRIGMRQRPADGLLAGMWEFPGDVVVDEVSSRGALDALGAEGTRVVHLEPVPHAFSHLHVTYVAAVVVCCIEGSGAGGEAVEFLTRNEVDALPLPVAQQKIAAQAWRELENHARQ